MAVTIMDQAVGLLVPSNCRLCHSFFGGAHVRLQHARLHREHGQHPRNGCTCTVIFNMNH